MTVLWDLGSYTSIIELPLGVLTVGTEDLGDGVYKLRAGTPISAAGAVANTGDAKYLAAEDFFFYSNTPTQAKNVKVIETGYVDLAKAQAAAGIEYTDAAKKSLKEAGILLVYSRLDGRSVSGDGYYDFMQVVKITDTDITMGDVAAVLDAINTAGDHVVFDVSALNAGMYVCTIYINSGSYRIYDLVTGYEGSGLYTNSDTLYEIILGAITSVKHYTVRWDKINAQMSRLNDAATITTTTTNFKHSGSVNPSYANPFDSIYPWNGRKLCNIDLAAYMALGEGDSITDCVKAWENDADFSYTDANGVWVYTPEFYGRHYTLGNYEFFDVSNVMTQNCIHYPAQITGRWHGVKASLTIGGTAKNVLLPKIGMPCKREALSTIHGYAKNYGGSLVSVYELDASSLLYLVEYANYNCQAAIGEGVDALFRESSDLIKAAATDSDTVQIEYNATIAGLVIPGAIFDIGTANGGNQVGSFTVVSAAQDATDNTKLNVKLDAEVTVTTSHYWSVHGLANAADSQIGSKSGYIGTNGKCNAYYRGEVLWGNLWQYVLGAYHQADTNHIWLATDAGEADKYDAINTTKHVDTGIAISSTNGYIAALAFPDSKLSAPCFCTQAGGDAGSSNPVGDYFYNEPTSNTILVVGGHASIGSSDGLFYWRWSYAASISYWGSAGRPRLKSP